MWIDATSREDELGPARALGVGGEECATGIGVVGTRSEAMAANIGIWGS